MKALFCWIFLLFIVGVASEGCNNKTQCDHVGCDPTTELACSHGECTCVYHSVNCVTSACNQRVQCGGIGCKCRNPDDVWHCYNHRCVCGLSGLGIGVGK